MSTLNFPVTGNLQSMPDPSHTASVPNDPQPKPEKNNDITLSYAFLPEGYNETKVGKVTSVIGEWSKHGNVRFDQVSLGENPNIRISFNTRDGLQSYVGNEVADIPQDEATMNLAWVTAETELSADERGVILHEFSHTLGLMHEHESPARGDNITLIENAVCDLHMDSQGWSSDVETQITDDLFEHIIRTEDGINKLSPIDALSMYVGKCALASVLR